MDCLLVIKEQDYYQISSFNLMDFKPYQEILIIKGIIIIKDLVKSTKQHKVIITVIIKKMIIKVIKN